MPSATPDTRPTRADVLLLGFTFAMGCAVGLVFTSLAELQDRFGLTDAQLGGIAGVSFISTMLTTLAVGPLADRGYGRWMTGVGGIVTGLSLVAFAMGSSFPVFFVARLLQGAGYGIFIPAARRAIARAHPGRSAQALGWMAGCELSGVIVGPALGALLAEQAGFDAPFWAVAAVIAIGTVAVLFGPRVVDVVGAHHGEERPSAAGSFLALLGRRPLLGALALSLAIYLPVGLYDSLWARYLTDRGAGRVFIGFSLLSFGIPAAVLAGRAGRWADRSGARKVANYGALLIIPTTALYGLVHRPIVIGGLGFIEGVGQAAVAPAVTALIFAASPRERSGAGQSLGLAINQSAAAASAFIGPVAYGRFGAATLFIAASILMAACWVTGLGLLGSSGSGPVESIG